MNEKNMTEVNIETEDLQGRYLLFNIDNMEYSVSLAMVLEIIQTRNITHLPHLAPYIKGIINLRGKIVPVIDVRLKFGIEEKPMDDQTCIIIAEVKNMQIGLIVDTVSEVVTVDKNKLSIPPATKEMSAWYVDSVTERNNKVVLNINLEKLFREDVAVHK